MTRCGEMVSHQAHNLGTGGSIPPIATKLTCCVKTTQK